MTTPRCPLARALALLLIALSLALSSSPAGLPVATSVHAALDDDDDREDDGDDGDDDDGDNDNGRGNNGNNGNNGKGNDKEEKEKKDKADKDKDKDTPGNGKGDEGQADGQATYRVDAECRYDEGADTTDCTVSASAGGTAGRINTLVVPASILCAQPISTTGDFAEPDRPTGVTGYRTKGNDTAITLTFPGEVRAEGTTTYTVRSGNAILQISAPGFACGSVGDHLATAARVPLQIAALYCDGAGVTGARFATAPSVTTAIPAELFDDIDAASCVPAAEIGFSVSTADGQVIVRAATDGLGEAELSLTDGVYIVTEGVSNASGTIEVRVGEPLTVAIAILSTVDPDAEGASETPVVNPSTETQADHQRAESTPAGNGTSSVNDSTGAISVQLYSCPANTSDPADWEEVCAPGTGGIAFRLSEADGETITPRSVGRTDTNGVLLFSRLEPGTYKLTEDGGDWCHAKSDNVNDAGLLEVRAGQQTNVLIFNCDGN